MRRVGVITLLLALSAGLIWALRGRFRRWSLSHLRRVRRNSQRIPTTRGSIEYRMVGTGPAVLLIHGAPGGYDSGGMLSGLQRAGFTVLTPSRPGYSRTPLKSGRSTPEQVALIIALLDNLHIQQVVVVGFSLGGPIALELAKQHPSRVRGLVLLSAITHRYALEDPLEETLVGTSWVPRLAQSLLFWVSHRLYHYLPRLATESVLRGTYTGDALDDCVDYVMQSADQRTILQSILDSGVPLRLRQRGYDNDIRQLRAMPAANLADIATPTLILHGTKDSSIPFKHAEFAYANLPDARLVPVEGCGHFLLLGTGADTVNRELSDFVARCFKDALNP